MVQIRLMRMLEASGGLALGMGVVALAGMAGGLGFGVPFPF